MTRTLYRGASGGGGQLAPPRPYDEFLFFADPMQDFIIDDVITDNKYEREGTHWISNLRYTQLHEMWDGLMAENPDYITKTLLGRDQSNTFDIFKYTINGYTPKDNNNRAIPGRKIRVFVETVHSEFNNRVYMFEFARLLFTQDHLPVIAALKDCCEFVFMPAANPYGLENSVRQNSRGVDINSNQRQGWQQKGEPWDFQYSGTKAESEAETRILYQAMADFKPDIHIACHSHGNQEEDGSFFWHVPNPEAGINNTAWKGSMRACTNFKLMYPDLRPFKDLVQLRTNIAPEGKGRSTDAAWSLGAVSMSLEMGGSLDVNGKAGVSGSKEAITLSVMGLLFCLLEGVKRVMYY